MADNTNEDVSRSERTFNSLNKNEGCVKMVERSMIQESAGQVQEGIAFSELGAAVGAMSNRTVQATANATDITRKVQELSPTSQQSLNVLISSMAKGDAYIDYDSSGKQVIKYKEVKRKKFYDASQAHIIAIPKSDEEVKIKIDACLELINYFKSEKSPSGVLLDETQICVSKQYREGEEFEPTGQVLGSGNSAGDIIIVKDKKTLKEHAMKTMLMSLMSEDEIRCWVDMIDSGYAPSLYLFRIEDNKVSMHMEILHNAVTLRSIIDEHISNVCKKDRSLLKPFSLYVLKGVLDAVSSLHQKGWAHHDLHAKNVMLQKESGNWLKVKMIDFGLAKRFEGPLGLDFDGFRKDIGEVVRLFSALYTGEEFDNVRDARKNWKSKLSEVHLNEEDKIELFHLVENAFKLVILDGLKDYISLVEEHQKAAFKNGILESVSAILFPDQTKDCMQNSDILTNQDEAADSHSCSKVTEETEETGNVISLRGVHAPPGPPAPPAPPHPPPAQNLLPPVPPAKPPEASPSNLPIGTPSSDFGASLRDSKGVHAPPGPPAPPAPPLPPPALNLPPPVPPAKPPEASPSNLPIGTPSSDFGASLRDSKGVHAPPGPPAPPAPPLPPPALNLLPPVPPAKPPEASPSNLPIGTPSSDFGASLRDGKVGLKKAVTVDKSAPKF